MGKKYTEEEFTEADAAHLTSFPQLKVLRLLGGANVTDTHLAYLERLGQLEELNLSLTKVTDAGLVHLEGMTRLQMLDLSGTQVTDEGVTRLERALPNCRIER